MSQHLHSTYVEGCFRCDLSRDELPTDAELIAELQAENDGLLARVAGLEDGVRQIARARCLCDGHPVGCKGHGGPCCGVAGGRCVTCQARALGDTQQEG